MHLSTFQAKALSDAMWLRADACDADALRETPTDNRAALASRVQALVEARRHSGGRTSVN